MSLRFSFTRGLCEWCGAPGGCGRCCYVSCCFPCAFGSLVEKLGPNDVICGGNCLAGFAAAALSGYVGAPCLVISPARQALRRKYGIKGDTCEDIVCGTVCAPCVLCQMLNEVDINRTASAFVPPPGLPTPAVYGEPVYGQAQYVPPPQMPALPTKQTDGYTKLA